MSNTNPVTLEQMKNSDIKSNDATAPSTIQQTSVMYRAGEDIGIKDANGNDIFVGAVIEFNKELFLIKWSDKQKQFVARKEPLKGQKMSWRDMNWIKKLANKYIKMVGTILFDEKMRKRFEGVYR